MSDEYTVNLIHKYKRSLKEMGTTIEEATPLEKKQAMLNAIIEMAEWDYTIPKD